MLRANQKGITLLDALATMLIFTFGSMGLIKFEMRMLLSSQLSQQRAQANLVVNQLLSVASADIGNGPCYVVPVLSPYPASCPATAQAFTNAWVTQVNNTFKGGSAPIAVYNAATGLMTVTISWKMNSDVNTHNYSATAQVQ